MCGGNKIRFALMVKIWSVLLEENPASAQISIMNAILVILETLTVLVS